MKWSKLDQNSFAQFDWHAHTYSETTEPIFMNYAPFDAPRSETVPSLIFL